ncbi:MAG TPA: DUF1501 domain-containing protein, partial [Planctomycetaceae bacterium]|nr:DUF1501 domain-containing protein [Planctomycetaceae bacterium]
MLSFCDPRHGMGRREFLRIGGLGLGGLTLPQLLASHSLAAAPKRSVRDKSVIFLFLHGGPSQIETFDPKMTAPIDIRSATGEVATSLPGITFGGTLQKLAPLADKFSIVRSFTTGDGNHDIKPVVGVDSLKANLGSIYSRVAGLNHPVTGMPLNAALFPQSVDPKAGPAQEGFGKFYSTGSLSSAYAPFVPGANGDFQNDIKLTLPR